MRKESILQNLKEEFEEIPFNKYSTSRSITNEPEKTEKILRISK